MQDLVGWKIKESPKQEQDLVGWKIVNPESKPTTGIRGVANDFRNSLNEFGEDAYNLLSDPSRLYELTKNLTNEAGQGIQQFTGQGPRDLPFQSGNAELRAPEPMRGAKNALAGLASGIHGVAATPGNIADYLEHKEILSPGMSKTLIPRPKEKRNYAEELGLGAERGGDRFIRQVTELLPSIVAGEKGLGGASFLRKIGQRSGALAQHAAGQNEDPLKAALAYPAAELGIKGVKGAIKAPVKAYESIKSVAQTIGESPIAEDFISGLKKLGGNRDEIRREMFSNLLPEEIQPTLKNFDDAKQIGITLTPAEASGNSIVAQAEGKLGSSKEGQKALYKFKKERKLQEQRAINNLLSDIAPTSKNAAADVRSTAESIIKKREQDLLKQSKPYYEEAVKKKVAPNIFKNMMKDSNIAHTYNKVRSNRKYGTELEGYDPHSVKVLDMVYKDLEQQIGDELAKAKPNKNDVRILTGAAKKLVNNLDRFSPDYKMARKIYGEGSKPIQKIKNSPIGKLARTQDAGLKNISKNIFDPSQTDLNVLQNVRDSVYKANPKAWDNIVRNELERKIGTKNLGKTGNYGSNFFDNVLANDAIFDQFSEALKYNKTAQQKLGTMKHVFKDLLNEYTPKTAKGLSKSSLDVPRSTAEFITKAVDKITGGKHDKAAIQEIVDAEWNRHLYPNSGAKK